MFPRTKFVDENTLRDQLKHLQSEIDEVDAEVCHAPVNFERVASELWDAIGSAETALRILAEKYHVDIHAARDQVIQGNHRRGYYRG